jgi:hypothetical protein
MATLTTSEMQQMFAYAEARRIAKGITAFGMAGTRATMGNALQQVEDWYTSTASVASGVSRFNRLLQAITAGTYTNPQKACIIDGYHQVRL